MTDTQRGPVTTAPMSLELNTVPGISPRHQSSADELAAAPDANKQPASPKSKSVRSRASSGAAAANTKKKQPKKQVPPSFSYFDNLILHCMLLSAALVFPNISTVPYLLAFLLNVGFWALYPKLAVKSTPIFHTAFFECAPFNKTALGIIGLIYAMFRFPYGVAIQVPELKTIICDAAPNNEILQLIGIFCSSDDVITVTAIVASSFELILLVQLFRFVRYVWYKSKKRVIEPKDVASPEFAKIQSDPYGVKKGDFRDKISGVLVKISDTLYWFFGKIGRELCAGCLFLYCVIASCGLSVGIVACVITLLTFPNWVFEYSSPFLMLLIQGQMLLTYAYVVIGSLYTWIPDYTAKIIFWGAYQSTNYGILEMYSQLIPIFILAFYGRRMQIFGRKRALKPIDELDIDLIVRTNDIDEVERVIWLKPEMLKNFSGSEGKNILHTLVSLEKVHILKVLVEHFSTDDLQLLVNSKDSKGDTPLSLACRLGEKPMIRLLLQAGADPRIETESHEQCIELFEKILEEKEKSLILWVKDRIFGVIKTVFKWILLQAQLITLAFLFVTSLQSADYLHAGYLVFFLFMMTNPHLSAKIWPILVIYCQLTFTFVFLCLVWSDLADLMESYTVVFVSYDDFVYNIIILFMSQVQLNLNSVGTQLGGDSSETSGKELITKMKETSKTHSKLLKMTEESDAMAKAFEDLAAIVKALLIEWVLFIVYFLYIYYAFGGSPNLLKFGFVVLVIINAVVHQSFSPTTALKVQRFVWTAMSIYSMLVVIAIYAYQFDFISGVLGTVNSALGLGLSVYSTRDFILNTYLPALAYCCTVIVLRQLFNSDSPHHQNEESERQVSTETLLGKMISMGQRAGSFFVKRLCEAAPHLTLLLCALMSFYRVDVIGACYLVIVLYSLPSPTLRRIVWFPMMVLSSFSLMIRYFVQLPTLGVWNIDTSSSIFTTLGLVQIEDGDFWTSSGLLPEILIILFSTIQRITFIVANHEGAPSDRLLRDATTESSPEQLMVKNEIPVPRKKHHQSKKSQVIFVVDQFVSYLSQRILHFVRHFREKYTVEITMYLLIITSFIRVNMMSVLYMSCIVLVYAVRGKKPFNVRKNWIILTTMMILSITSQYAVLVLKYQIEADSNIQKMSDSVCQFLLIKGFDSKKIFADFFTLYIAMLHPSIKPFVAEAKDDIILGEAPPLYKQLRFVLLMLSDKVILICLFFTASLQVSLIRIPYFIFVLGLLYTYGFYINIPRFWKILHLYTCCFLSLTAIYQLPLIPWNFGVSYTYDDFSWENLIGVKKLDSVGIEAFSSDGVRDFVILFILVDIQLLLYKLKVYKTLIVEYEKEQVSLRLFRKQENFHTFHEAIRKQFEKFERKKVSVIKNLEDVFASKNADKISWSKFADEELWPYRALAHDEAITAGEDINKIECGVIGVSADYEITMWNVHIASLTGLSEQDVVSTKKAPEEGKDMEEKITQADETNIGSSSDQPVEASGLEKPGPFDFFPDHVKPQLEVWIDACVARDYATVEIQLPIRTILSDISFSKRDLVSRQHPVHVELTVQPIKDEDEEVVGAAVMVREMIEMRALYMEKEQTKEFAELLDDADGAAFVIDKELVFKECNQGLESITGFEEEELQGRLISEIFAASSKQQLEELHHALEELLTQKEAKPRTITLKISLKEESPFGAEEEEKLEEEKKRESTEITLAKEAEARHMVVKVSGLAHVREDKSISGATILVRLNSPKDKAMVLLKDGVQAFKDFLDANTDHSLFAKSKVLHASSDGGSPNPAEPGLLVAIGRYIFSHTQEIAFAMFILSLLINGDLVSLVVPLSILFYALAEYPYAPKGYWMTVLAYLLVVMSLKCLYQLPLFCTDTAGLVALHPNPSCVGNKSYQSSYSSRRDWIIGIHKARTTFAAYVAADVFCFLSIVLHRFILTRKDGWNWNGRPTEHIEAPMKIRMDRFFTENRDPESFFGIHKILSKAFSKIGFEIDQPTFIQRYLYYLMPLDPINKQQIDFEVKPGADYYTFTFIFEIIAAIYSIFFWGDLVSSAADVQAAFANSRFPWKMVAFFCSEVVIMAIERVIYLYRSVFAKLILQLSTLLYFNWFVFVYCPKQSSDGGFKTNSALIFFFLIKLCYFIPSSLQIRYGYPSAIIRHNFFTKKTSGFRPKVFEQFLSLPFIFELRTVITWMCIDTALDIKDTFVFEDIYSKIFLRKCDLDEDQEGYRGEKKSMKEKVIKGTLFTIGCLLLLLGPLIIYSDANPSTTSNLVTSGQIQLQMTSSSGTFLIFSCTSLANLRELPSGTYSSMTSSGYISSDKSNSDCQEIVFNTFSDQQWIITSPGFESFLSGLADTSTAVTLDVTYSLTRPYPSGYTTISSTNSITMSSTVSSKLANTVSENACTYRIKLRSTMLFQHQVLMIPTQQ
jgi:PAS domain S-box-containing protein